MRNVTRTPGPRKSAAALTIHGPTPAERRDAARRDATAATQGFHAAALTLLDHLGAIGPRESLAIFEAIDAIQKSMNAHAAVRQLHRSVAADRIAGAA